jgi:hypothetical protein
MLRRLVNKEYEKGLDKNGCSLIEVPFRYFSEETEEKALQTCQDNLHFCSESKQAPPECIYRPLFFINLLGSFLSHPVRMKTEIKAIILKSTGNLEQWTKTQNNTIQTICHNIVKSFKLTLLSLILLQLTRTCNKQTPAPTK